ncbi:MAG: type II toxin-antitoxin system VapC family toxin [Terriglobales bacterium]
MVVDTNVAVYLILHTQPFHEEVSQFWASLRTAAAPAHWQAEFAQVVWMAARAGILRGEEAAARLELAAQLPVASEPLVPLWRGAMRRSIETGVAVYDTLFVELASQRGCPLATFDGELLRKFPAIARRPAALM